MTEQTKNEKKETQNNLTILLPPPPSRPPPRAREGADPGAAPLAPAPDDRPRRPPDELPPRQQGPRPRAARGGDAGLGRHPRGRPVDADGGRHRRRVTALSVPEGTALSVPEGSAPAMIQPQDP